MRTHKKELGGPVRRMICRLAAIFCNLCLLAGGFAVLCGFGMSDTMTAPKAFCMLLSAAGAAAMVLGLRLHRLQDK